MSKFAALFGLLAGICLLAWWGSDAPAWLLRLECVCVMTGALVMGFTRHNLALPGWLKSEAVKGVCLIYLGVGVVFFDFRLLVSAFLIGSGCRKVLKSAAPLVRVVGVKPLRQPGEILIREGGGIRRA